MNQKKVKVELMRCDMDDGRPSPSRSTFFFLLTPPLPFYIMSLTRPSPKTRSVTVTGH